MIQRDRDDIERSGEEMGLGVQFILGLFLMSAFVALVWWMFGGG